MSTTTTTLEQYVSALEVSVASGDVTTGKAVLQEAKLTLVTTTGKDALVAQALECGCLLSLADGDLDSFSRLMSLLLPLYNSKRNTTNEQQPSASAAGSPTTDRQPLILGLHLMHLLVEHRLSEFHSVLEVISEQDDASSSPFLSYPIGLERQLMVGMYDDIIFNPKAIPDPAYQFFVDHYLQQTVRDSIADGMEVSYQSLTLQEAKELMKFDTVQQLKEYIAEHRDDWIIDEDENDGQITYSPVDTTVSASDIAASDWIQQSLQYATEMERIV